MVIDTSAVVAILFREPEQKHFIQLIHDAELRLMSAASVLETGTVVEASFGEIAGRDFDLFLSEAEVNVVSVDREQVEIARSAWRKYGKGRHRAALNFGDCLVYALAKVSGEPILAKGNDFPLTDIQLCTPGS
ncbi:MAG: type II toxin-antitoxin system VapC family toxin [Candidatus Korobacteraceae bacterium]|jgi:ribonuclease VapC